MPTDQDPRALTTRSIREPGASPRDVPAPLEARVPPLAPPRLRPQGPAPAGPVRAARSRPDANPLRLMIGFAGLASAAAFTTAMLPSVTPAPAADQALAPVGVTADPAAAPSVQHVTRYVQLQPGQTAPPQSTVVVNPKPTPRVTVKVVTKTRQSGQP